MRWIGSTLAVVVTGLDEMPEVIDDAGAEERTSFRVPRDTPRVARPFREELELARLGMNAKQCAGEVELLAVLLHDALVEDAVETVQPAVRSPGKRVWKLVRVIAAKAG